jgi:hypothetical protein
MVEAVSVVHGVGFLHCDIKTGKDSGMMLHCKSRKPQHC